MSNKKEEPNAASQRIASLSKDPDNSPSSRSSTSSWYFFVIIISTIINVSLGVRAGVADGLKYHIHIIHIFSCFCAWLTVDCPDHYSIITIYNGCIRKQYTDNFIISFIFLLFQ